MLPPRLKFRGSSWLEPEASVMGALHGSLRIGSQGPVLSPDLSGLSPATHVQHLLHAPLGSSQQGGEVKMHFPPLRAAEGRGRGLGPREKAGNSPSAAQTTVLKARKEARKQVRRCEPHLPGSRWEGDVYTPPRIRQKRGHGGAHLLPETSRGGGRSPRTAWAK